MILEWPTDPVEQARQRLVLTRLRHRRVLDLHAGDSWAVTAYQRTAEDLAEAERRYGAVRGVG
jgi:hypothetical protein